MAPKRKARKTAKAEPEPSTRENDPKSDSEDNEDLSREAPDDINPYEVLEVPRDADVDVIKRSYRKKALQHHPGMFRIISEGQEELLRCADKVEEAQKAEAHEKFQAIALAYAVLSSSDRRKHYDATGSTAETLSSAEDFSWRDYYASAFADAVSLESIATFAASYRKSSEERGDIIAAYTQYEGDIGAVFESVMCSDFLEDEARFRAVIDAAIEDGEVEAYDTYAKEGKAKREQRVKSAKREAKEAEKAAEEMGVADKLFGKGGKKSKKGDDQAGLRDIILARQKSRQETFLDDLERKYAPKPKAKKRKVK